MRHLLLTAVFSLCSVCVGQRLTTSINEGGGPNTYGLIGGGFAYAVPIPSFGVGSVSAVQLHMSASLSTFRLSIFDSNPTLGGPGNELAFVDVSVWGNVRGYWGGVLNNSVTLQPSSSYFLVVSPGSGISMSVATSAGMPAFTMIPGNSWTGPTALPDWSIRFYSGHHSGTFTPVGTAKAGTVGTPFLVSHGWPNTNNPIELSITQVPVGSACLYVAGAPATTTLPFATLYAQPDVTLFSVATNGTTSLGLTIPYQASLQGYMFAAQALVLDPGATFGISHTAGVIATVGH